MTVRLDTAFATLPHRYPGPGGAVAVLREGNILLRHAWGYADMERRIAFTPRTLFRVCSITKQFTCAVVRDLVPDPAVLHGEVRARLPGLGDAAPRTVDLCNNQSGLRDYWAVAMLAGARPEDPFGPEDAARVIGTTRSLQFRPGTRYSYCNYNFRLLSDIAEARSGTAFPLLLRRRVFDRAGMESATFVPETRAMPDGTVGYEGSLAQGFRAAVNRIHWTGDAGLVASLDDLIAWERFIDGTREEADGLYTRLAGPVKFADGGEAFYGMGLSRGTLFGRRIIGHGGGLRGWRSFRFYAPAERISVVVLFNHMADPRAAAQDLFAAVLGERPAALPEEPAPAWAGTYTEPETGLAARIEAMPDRRLALHFSGSPELLTRAADGSYGSATARIAVDGEGLSMLRPADNLRTRLVPLRGTPAPDIEGTYHSRESDASITVADAGGVLYAACAGLLGQGEMQKLVPFGPDTWLMPCPRALDFSPPGDWTLTVRRDGAGRPAGLTVGCWLARGIDYARA
jgi:D-aminopeptidase